MPRPATEPFVQHFKIELPAETPHGFESFAALVSPMFDLTRIHADQPFHAQVATTLLPDIFLSRTAAAASRYERHPKAIARSGTDAIVVLVYRSGRFTFEIDGRSETVDTDEIAFFDLSQPLSIQAEQVDNISLVIARQRLEAITPSVRDIHGFVLKAGAMRDLLLAHMQACIDTAHRMPAADAAAISDITVRLVATSWNSVTRRTGASARHAGLASLGEIRTYIEGHLSEPDLGPTRLLQAFNLSRATLYRMFEPIGGVAAFILERRMHRAFQLIAAPDSAKPRIQELALQLGFQHPSAFSRAFKKQFGVSPQAVRLRQVVPENGRARPWKIPRTVEPLVAEGTGTKR